MAAACAAAGCCRARDLAGGSAHESGISARPPQAVPPASSRSRRSSCRRATVTVQSCVFFPLTSAKKPEKPLNVGVPQPGWGHRAVFLEVVVEEVLCGLGGGRLCSVVGALPNAWPRCLCWIAVLHRSCITALRHGLASRGQPTPAPPARPALSPLTQHAMTPLSCLCCPQWQSKVDQMLGKCTMVALKSRHCVHPEHLASHVEVAGKKKKIKLNA